MISALRLKHNSFVDPLYLSNSEIDVKSFFDCLQMKPNYEKDDGLIVKRKL